MAPSPREQEIAIIRNLPVQTGKSLSEWMAVLRQSNILNAKERLNWLKTQYRLGHFQAQIIIRRFNNSGEGEYDDPKFLLKQHFSAENASLWAIYIKITSTVLPWGHDIQVKPCKTYIPFYRNRIFLVVRAKKGILYLGFPLSKNHAQEKMITGRGLGMPQYIKHVIAIDTLRGLNQQVFKLIRSAYDNV